MSADKEYPKILILSDAAWTDDNNIGNTFSNLFKGWPKDKIAMIYARPDLPNTAVCDTFFQISENRLIKNLLNSSTKTGIKIDRLNFKNSRTQKSLEREEVIGKKIYRFFLKYRWNIFLIARELLWKIGKWKTKELDEFIHEFNPDTVLSLACSSIYMNNLQYYVINTSKAKSILYFVDDVYSMKRLSFSPLFWINKLTVRKNIKKTAGASDLVYTIVPKQKKEYDKNFNINSKLLSKGGVFEDVISTKIKINYPLKLVYTGNIYAGRWTTLERMGRALDKINEGGNKGVLCIYSKNELTSKMKRALSKINSIRFMGGIPLNKVNEVQKNADILVHVESLYLKEKLLTRLSFSTKLVDYFTKGKCILAVGWNEAASIEYLKKNDLAVIVDSLDKIYPALSNLLDDPKTITKFSQQAWNFGKENHDISNIMDSLKQDMVQLTLQENKER